MTDIVYTPINKAVGTNVPDAKEPLLMTLLKQGEFIHKSAQANGNNDYEPIYEVPEGYVFFLLTASLAVRNLSANSVRSFINIDRSGEILYVTLPYSSFGAADVFHAGTNTISPSIPLLMTAGNAIEVFNQDVASVTYASITGYILPAPLFYKII